MKNVDKLEDDTSRDDRINNMDNNELVKAWAGWHLGDGSWWDSMKYYFDELEKG